MWRLDTADGSWAVKVPFHRSSEEEVSSATAFQGGGPRRGRTDTAGAANHGRIRDRHSGRPAGQGVPVGSAFPRPVSRPGDGGRSRGRHPPGRGQRPRPAGLWSHEPVGAGRWDELVGAGVQDGATQCAPDLSPRPVGRQRPAQATAECASSTVRTAVRPTPAKSPHSCSSSSPVRIPPRPHSLAPTKPSAPPWLLGADILDAAWTGEMLDEPDTRELNRNAIDARH